MTQSPLHVGHGANGLAALLLGMACNGHQAAGLGTLDERLYLQPDTQPDVWIPPAWVEPSGYQVLKAIEQDSEPTSPVSTATATTSSATGPASVGSYGDHTHTYSHLHEYTHAHTLPAARQLFDGDRVVFVWIGELVIVLGRF